MARVQCEVASNAWAKFPDICIPRAKFGSEVTDEVIFAIGGRDEITNMKHVECYDEETSKWFIHRSHRAHKQQSNRHSRRPLLSNRYL